MKIFLAETGHIQGKDDSFDYSTISANGELELANHQDPSHVLDKNLDAQILIVGRLVWSRETLAKFPNLRLIVKMGTGVEKIDLAAARERGIAVANLSGYAAAPVGQATMAYIFSFASSLPQYDRDVRRGKWKETQFTHPMMILKDKCLGIIGLGGISRWVIQFAKYIGMRINVYTRYPDPALDVKYVDLDTVATDSDFISIHCALDNHTRGIVNTEFLAKVKKSAYLINTARPAVVEEKAINC
jgi:glycerate dehydrogenase